MKLFNSDCLEVMRDMIKNGAEVDCIITDPPYKTTKRGISKNTTTGGLVRSELGKQGKIFMNNDIEIQSWLPLCYKLLKNTGHFYIMTNHKNLHHYLNIAKANNLHFIKSLIWNKSNKIMGQSYMSQFEYILFFRKGAHKKINKCGTPDILEVSNKKTKNEQGENIHDTEKPVELMKILVGNSTSEKEIVFDPFMGVGGLGVACKELNRNFVGIEINPEYYKIAVSRNEDQSPIYKEEIKGQSNIFEMIGDDKQ